MTMSASLERTRATRMLHALIHLGHSSALVNLVTLVMEHSAQVKFIPVSVPKMLYLRDIAQNTTQTANA